MVDTQELDLTLRVDRLPEIMGVKLRGTQSEDIEANKVGAVYLTRLLDFLMKFLQTNMLLTCL